MTKKTALQLIATVALAAGFIGVSGVTANAADTDATNEQTTQATVGLTAGDGTGTHSGSVELTAAPDLAFGSHEITGAADSFTIAPNAGITTNGGSTNKDSAAGNVEVVNKGSETGWNVTVAASPFTDSSSNKTLLGSSIELVGSVATTNTDGIETNPATINGKDQQATTVVTPAAESAKAETVLTADANNGLGTWQNKISTARLNIAGGNSAGTYASTLTWTIADTPYTQA